MSNCSTGGGDNGHGGVYHLGDGSGNFIFNGNASVYAGNGNDTITIGGHFAYVNVGNGNDSISLTDSHGEGKIIAGTGNDTINIGSGNDTITVLGNATIIGSFGSATVSAGTYTFDQHSGGGGCHDGKSTISGGHSDYNRDDNSAKSGSAGHSGSDTTAGGQSLAFLNQGQSDHSVLSNFVTGGHQMLVDGHSLAYLPTQHDISSSGGDTHIKMDGGHTMIELKGILPNISDGSTHK